MGLDSDSAIAYSPLMTYDEWKTTEPPESGAACIDCHRREATASDGLCDECADASAKADEASEQDAQLTLSEEWTARELAAEDERREDSQ